MAEVTSATLGTVIYEPESTGLAGDHAVGAMVLSVVSGRVFGDLGSMRLGGHDYPYFRDGDTLRLDEPGLLAAAEDADPVERLNAAGAPESRTVGMVDFDGDGEFDEAEIPTGQRGYFLEGDSQAGAVVDVESTEFGYRIVSRPFDEDVLAPDTLDRTRLSEIIAEDAPSGGGTARTDADTPPPDLDDATGYAEGHTWWQWDTLDPAPGLIPELVGFWRVQGGAWVPGSVVSADAAVFQNAVIGALQVTGLNAVSIDGGSIYIARGEAADFTEPFSGTGFPVGWVSSKTDKDGGSLGGIEGTAVPGASVVTSGPSGQSGSALLIDFGAADITDESGKAAGSVTPPLAAAADAVMSGRFRVQLVDANSTDAFAQTYLAVRSSGTPFSSGWDAVTLELSDSYGGSFGVTERSFDIEVWSNGNRTLVGEVEAVADPSVQWCRAELKVQAGVIAARVWVDGEPESPWTTLANVSIPVNPGATHAAWRQWGTNNPTSGQKVWFDELSATTYEVGFQVTPDGIMTSPATGIGIGDPAWRTVGASGQPAFQNGWANVSGQTLAFRKSPTGDVTVTGQMAIPSGGGSNTVIFTLPEGHRPTRTYGNMTGFVNAGNRVCVVTVNPNGTVVWADLGNTGGTLTDFTVQFSTL